MRQFVLVLCVALTVFACGKKETATTDSTSSAESQTAPTPAATATTANAAAPQEPDLLAFSAGALVVQKPQEYNESWSAFWLTDERPQSGWASPENVIRPQTAVLALPEKTQLERLAFDTASIDGDGRGAKDVVVEVSDTSATAGFQQIAAVSLQDRADNQLFPVSARVPGRWVRVTIKNNHGAKDYVELMEVRGFGKQLTQTPFPDASGTYRTNFGDFHLKQEGTSVTGCYEYNDGLLNGGIEGRVMKFTWTEGEKRENRGPATMVFSPDGKQMFGLYWHDGDTSGTGGIWDGEKVSNEVGSCPHWSGSGAEAQMQKDLEEFGRTRIYGINFDTDSDVIKPESKPTLDKIVAVLKAQPEWHLKVEGHTDSTGGDAHNQQLSQKRADAVKNYLVQAGVDGARLTTAGLGASQPVSNNDTESGRAQNRRVELEKQ